MNRNMLKGPIKTWSTPVTGEQSRVIPCILCGGGRLKPSLVCAGFSYVRCTGCGLVQMNPQPLAAEVARRYQENHGTDYLSYELANEKTFLHLQELALADAGFAALEKDLLAKAHPAILDVGCATGALLEILRERGWETTGVEICTPAQAYAQEVRNLDVRALPLEENHFPAHTFDVVLASHLIEHLNDPRAFIQEVHRILRPGGYFLVTTPNIGGFQARFFKNRWRSAIFDHLFLFSIKTLSQLLRCSDFEVVQVCTWGGLAAGTAPGALKRVFDRGAKRFGFGDVMLIKGRRR
ncbi:MAG: class I SAM-dependent methyltransferase [Treponema sp.]|jgi:2-polyprenyl-3-methyl-5-hydroxy-6-metoxy-1,4-benzoquinol methylase|nr:class I SAM-dependent methyltransferase [Treponema sp.]